MSQKFVRLTSGWIPVSVLLLFAAALVTGQEPTDLPAQDRLPSAPMTPSIEPELPDWDDHEAIESIRILVDAVLPSSETLLISVGATLGVGHDIVRPDRVPVE